MTFVYAKKSPKAVWNQYLYSFFIFNLAENIIVRANSLANSLLKILPEALVESCIWRFFMQKDDLEYFKNGIWNELFIQNTIVYLEVS